MPRPRPRDKPVLLSVGVAASPAEVLLYLTRAAAGCEEGCSTSGCSGRWRLPRAEVALSGRLLKPVRADAGGRMRSRSLEAGRGKGGTGAGFLGPPVLAVLAGRFPRS